MAPIYVYGFPPRTSEQEFRQKFFENHNELEYCDKIDYKGDRIYAFVHTKSLEQANELIKHWNGRSMEGNGQHTLQVRHKGQAAGDDSGNSNMPKAQNQNRYNNTRQNTNNQNQRGGYNNYNQYNNPTQTNSNLGYASINNEHQQQQQMMQSSNDQYGRNDGMGMMQSQTRNTQQQFNNPAHNYGPQKPVLYVYGFPKTLTEDEFNEIFLENRSDQHKQTDYFQEKIYSFVHFHNNEVCDELIALWDGKPMKDGKKPLQVRYKGMDAQTAAVLDTLNPVLWVYGFPKNTSKETFQAEFFQNYPTACNKIDFYPEKLYAFVHCNSPKQCQSLINRWDTKLMLNSKVPLQVRFKSTHKATQSFNNSGMGDFVNQNQSGQFYNQTFANNSNQFYNNQIQHSHMRNINNQNQMIQSGGYINQNAQIQQYQQAQYNPNLSGGFGAQIQQSNAGGWNGGAAPAGMLPAQMLPNNGYNDGNNMMHQNTKRQNHPVNQFPNQNNQFQDNSNMGGGGAPQNQGNAQNQNAQYTPNRGNQNGNQGANNAGNANFGNATPGMVGGPQMKKGRFN